MVDVQLLAKIHCLLSSLEDMSHCQNHLVDRLADCINFVGDTSNWVGQVVDELNSRIDAQDTQMDQLANMVNNFIGKVESQAKEIKMLKTNQEDHHHVINTMTAKVIALE